MRADSNNGDIATEFKRGVKKMFCRKLSEFISILLVIFVVVIYFVNPASAEEFNKVIRFGGFFTSAGGQSSSQSFDFTRAMLQLTNDEFGYKTSIERYSSLDEVKDALMKGEIDGGLLWSTQLVEMNDAGYEFYPWGTYMVGTKRKASYCLWHKKTDLIKKPEEIKNVVLMSADYSVFNLIQLREYLYVNGIDKPLWSIFSGFTRLPNANSAYIALAMGEADFFWTNDDGDSFLKLINPSVATQIEHRFCTDAVYARASIVLSKKSYTQAQYKEMSDTLDYATKNISKYEGKYPTIKALHSYLKIAKMKFMLASPDELNTEIKLYQKAKKNGWLGEAEFIVKKWKEQPIGQAASIKPDFEYCRITCEKSSEKMQCLDKCME